MFGIVYNYLYIIQNRWFLVLFVRNLYQSFVEKEGACYPFLAYDQTVPILGIVLVLMAGIIGRGIYRSM